jgi:hypothetical protein
MKKNLKFILGAVLLSARALTEPGAVHADALGTFTGIAESVGTIVIGKSTITPSFNVYTWDYGASYYQGFQKIRKSIRFNRIIGQYFFLQTQTLSGDPPATNTAAFPPDSVALWNMNCPQHLGTCDYAIQSYSLQVTCTQVSTGVAPPTGPFDISFKTFGTGLSESCSADPPGDNGFFRKQIEVPPFGFVTTVVGHPSFYFDYPFQCWAGEWWEYR